MVSRPILVFGSSKWRQKYVLSDGVVFVVFSMSAFSSIFEKTVFSIWLLATGIESLPLKDLHQSNSFLFFYIKKKGFVFQDFSEISWPILFFFCLKKREKSSRSRGVFFVVFPTSDFSQSSKNQYFLAI